MCRVPLARTAWHHGTCQDFLAWQWPLTGGSRLLGELSDITYFLAVAEAGGISRASEQLHTVQSNISAHIRSLETELGVQFRRHARGVSLTNASEACLAFAEQMTALMREAAQIVANEAEPAGTLTIGSMETTAGLCLPAILASDYPRVDLTLTTGTTSVLITMVADHRLDGAFVCAPIKNLELSEDVAFIEELVLVTASRFTELDGAFAHAQRMLFTRNRCATASA